MKSLIVIFAILFVGIIFIVIWDFTSNPAIDKTNYDEISWRLPLDSEVKNFGNSFDNSDIDLCDTYFIKKVDGEKYLIACDSGEGTWTYYTAYTNHNKIYSTSREITLTLTPPEMRVEEFNDDDIKEKSQSPVKSKASRKSVEAR